MRHEKKDLGIGLIFIAGLFLFNPTISVVDLLPDFIGYVILYFALRKIGDLNDHIDTAIFYTKRMMIVSAAQFLSLIVLFGFVTEQEKPTTYLLFSFVVSVFEIIFLSRLYAEFFEGITYLGARHGATEILEKRRTERFHSLTVFFFIAKAVTATLPEFSALTFRDGTKWEYIYDYVGLFRTVALMVMFPIGILWLVRLYRYVKQITRDRVFMETLFDKYEAEITPKKEIFIQRFATVAFTIFAIGLLFSLDLYMDNISIFPDFLCPFLIFVALLLLKKYVPLPKLSLYFCGAHFLTSLLTYIGTVKFYDKYTLLLTRNTTEAYDAYVVLGIVKTVDSIMFFLMIASLMPILQYIITEHTGFSPISESNVHQEDKIRYIHTTLTKRLRVSQYMALACAVSSPLVFFFTRLLYIAKDTSFLWMIEFVFYLVFIIYFTKTLFAIKREMGYKYLLS